MTRTIDRIRGAINNAFPEKIIRIYASDASKGEYSKAAQRIQQQPGIRRGEQARLMEQVIRAEDKALAEKFGSGKVVEPRFETFMDLSTLANPGPVVRLFRRIL